ncbi:MAG: polymerase sigma factor, sigma-70 family [Anaerocolumna sp.]|nr:polymerase sigma factor, sigma-70 family [Anaerocolumna sp.]
MEKINHDKYLEKLIDTYGDLVFSICIKFVKSYFDAEDLTQETFLSAYKNLSSFDGNNEKAWICRIATNKCLDYLKSARRNVIPTEDTYLSEVTCDTPTPLESMIESDVKQYLFRLCHQLKPPYQEIALDYFYYEKDISELVKESGKNIKTLQTQVYRAKLMLRKLWRKE